MKNFLCNLCRPIALLFLLATPAFAFVVTEHTTPNGHSFAYVHMPNASRTVISMAWVGGYAFLPLEKGNVEELGPVMMVNGGAGGLSPDKIIAQFEAMDSGARLYSSPDAFHGFVVAPRRDLAKAAEIANKVLAEPAFDPRWLKRFQRNYVENVTRYSGTLKGQAWLAMRNITVRDQPYASDLEWDADRPYIQHFNRRYSRLVCTHDLNR